MSKPAMDDYDTMERAAIRIESLEAEIAALKAQRDADTALLRELNERAFVSMCPICPGLQYRHAPDCRLAARLKDTP